VSGEEAGQFTFRAGNVVTGNPEAPLFRPGEVTVADGRIAYVGPPRTATAGRVIDLPEGMVCPALINAHQHAAMALFRGYADDVRLMPWLREHIWPVEQRLSGDDVYTGTLLACAEMIRSGTAAFLDMYMFPEAAVRASEEAGMRMGVSWPIVGTLESAAPRFQRLAEGLSRWADSRLTRVWMGPHAPYTCSEDLLREVGNYAREGGLGIHVHLSESREEVEDMRRERGLSPIAYARDVGILGPDTVVAHAAVLEGDDIAILQASGASVAHCPASNLKLGNGVAPVRQLLDGGVNVALGSDGAASTNTLDLFVEMRLAAWLQKSATGDPSSFTARDAFGLATTGGARALGLSTGVLAAGRPADLVATQGWAAHLQPVHDPVSTLVYAARPDDVRYTVIDGVMVLDDGIITTFDEEAVIREARERARRLVEAPA
jgi:5-methylthioadenosine/S-adenosylhomocysteine deaminase